MVVGGARGTPRHGAADRRAGDHGLDGPVQPGQVHQQRLVPVVGASVGQQPTPVRRHRTQPVPVQSRPAFRAGRGEAAGRVEQCQAGRRAGDDLADQPTVGQGTEDATGRPVGARFEHPGMQAPQRMPRAVGCQPYQHGTPDDPQRHRLGRHLGAGGGGQLAVDDPRAGQHRTLLPGDLVAFRVHDDLVGTGEQHLHRTGGRHRPEETAGQSRRADDQPAATVGEAVGPLDPADTGNTHSAALRGGDRLAQHEVDLGERGAVGRAGCRGGRRPGHLGRLLTLADHHPGAVRCRLLTELRGAGTDHDHRRRGEAHSGHGAATLDPLRSPDHGVRRIGDGRVRHRGPPGQLLPDGPFQPVLLHVHLTIRSPARVVTIWGNGVHRRSPARAPSGFATAAGACAGPSTAVRCAAMSGAPSDRSCRCAAIAGSG